MSEQQLISSLKELGQISPKKDWVFLTKSQILGSSTDFSLSGEQSLMRFFPLLRPFLGMATVFAIFFGLFGFAQNSVPGDFLFSLKRITEKGQAVFVSEENMPQASLELANKRLEELVRIAQTNQVKKLAPALNEFQASVSEASKNLLKMEATSSDPVVIKKIVDVTKELEGKIQKAMLLGVVFIDEKEISQLQGFRVRLLISDLEEMTLALEQKEILSRIKELAEEEEYSQALELYYLAGFDSPMILDPIFEDSEEELVDEEEPAQDELLSDKEEEEERETREKDLKE